MTNIPKDQRQIVASSALALICLLLGAGAIFWAKQQTDRTNASLLQIERRASDIRTRLRQVNVEEKEIRDKSALYHALVARNIIGDEQRLDWIELIDSIRETYRLFDIEYEISEKSRVGTSFGNLQIYSSELNFRLPLLHENDLFNFLEALQRQAPALVQVKHCEIRRISEGINRQPGDPNLESQCTLQWNNIGPAMKNGGAS